MRRSASLRLVAVYTIAFAAAVILLGVISLATTRGALTRQFKDRIESEAAALAQEYRTEGLKGVVEAVQERDRTPGGLDYALNGADGGRLAGRLASPTARLGWSTMTVKEPDGDPETVHVFATSLGGGYRLLVGGEDEATGDVVRLLVERFIWAFLGIIVIGLVLGYFLSRGIGLRIAAITGAAEAIIDGDLSRRVPARGEGDDLDHLAATFNRMLDRIQTLMDSLKQVSNDIAHDLRTPLTRLRARLETQAESAEALEELDAILETFAALLRIAQIEGGARRASFRATDLAALARTVADAFSPSAEELGMTLTLEAKGPVVVEGDAELLTQMIVNLVENGLRHAGRGARVRIVVSGDGPSPVLSVVDNGPGVPAAERDRLFDRFYRLERSRSTPGSGLGLALVAAVARLHGAEASLVDAKPGLEARVTFAAGA